MMRFIGNNRNNSFLIIFPNSFDTADRRRRIPDNNNMQIAHLSSNTIA